jgi:trimethylamine--corrinoid protein Co-methyltransferase
MVEDAIRSAPAQMTLAGRNPDRDILLEDKKNAYINFSGNINVVDAYTGEFRKSTKADLAAGGHASSHGRSVF